MQNSSHQFQPIISKLMKTSLNQISDPILLTFLDGSVCYANAAAIASSGYSQEQLVQKKIDEILPSLTVNLLQRLRRTQQFVEEQAIITANNDVQLFEVQAHYNQVNGEEGIALILKLTPIVQQPQINYSNIQYQDKLLELIINNIPEQIFWKDRNQVYLGCNRHFAKVVGLDDPASIVGKTDYELKRDTTYAASYRSWDRQVIEQGEAVLNLEEPYYNADGTQGIVLTSKVPLKNQNGDVFGLVGICTEITDLKQMQAELIEANQLQASFNEQLEATVQSRTQKLKEKNQRLRDLEGQLRKALDKEQEINILKSNLITTISHEYRTPISKILIAIHLLKNYPENLCYEKSNQYLTTIHNSVKYLSNIVDDIVSLNEILSQNRTVQFDKVDLIEIYQEVISQIQSFQLTRHEFQLNNNRHQVWIKGDKTLLSNLLKRLLYNAFLYSKDRTTIITQIIGQTDYARLQVTDQGIGIPEEEQETIFNLFYRGSNVGNRPGTGIGLAIIKYITDLHEGEITVESELGKGTTFTIYFPTNLT